MISRNSLGNASSCDCHRDAQGNPANRLEVAQPLRVGGVLAPGVAAAALHEVLHLADGGGLQGLVHHVPMVLVRVILKENVSRNILTKNHSIKEA